jgi:hypothetical protein
MGVNKPFKIYQYPDGYPPMLRGPLDQVAAFDGGKWSYWYPWMADFRGTNTFIHLSADWENKSWPIDPEPGFDFYILSGDSGMSGWGNHVAELYQKPVFFIDLPEVYDTVLTHELVTLIPNIYYHKQLVHKDFDQLRLASLQTSKNIKYKASALTNRLTQSKIIIFSALYQTFGKDLLASLYNNLDLDNVHHWSKTEYNMLDNLTDYFRNEWVGKELIPLGTNSINQKNKNFAGVDIDPAMMSTTHPAYTECAINFTQESTHYSSMYDQNQKLNTIRSGPFLTEKTLKCLISQTAFIPVGQFRTYGWLKSAGLEFDYGLNLDFDNDPKNLSRLEKIVELIYSLKNYSANEIFEMTQHSTKKNYDKIMSGEFYEYCEHANLRTVKPMYETILG